MILCVEGQRQCIEGLPIKLFNLWSWEKHRKSSQSHVAGNTAIGLVTSVGISQLYRGGSAVLIYMKSHIAEPLGARSHEKVKELRYSYD